MEPCSAILAYLVKVVTLTTPTYVANIASEWLPCTDAYGVISLIKARIKKFLVS